MPFRPDLRTVLIHCNHVALVRGGVAAICSCLFVAVVGETRKVGISCAIVVWSRNALTVADAPLPRVAVAVGYLIASAVVVLSLHQRSWPIILFILLLLFVLSFWRGPSGCGKAAAVPSAGSLSEQVVLTDRFTVC